VIWSPSGVAALHFISIALLPSKQSISKVLGLVPSVFGIFIVADSGKVSKKHNLVTSSKN
jgi:multidrug transporter EmrE-like cation transporter